MDEDIWRKYGATKKVSSWRRKEIEEAPIAQEKVSSCGRKEIDEAPIIKYVAEEKVSSWNEAPIMKYVEQEKVYSWDDAPILKYVIQEQEKEKVPSWSETPIMKYLAQEKVSSWGRKEIDEAPTMKYVAQERVSSWGRKEKFISKDRPENARATPKVQTHHQENEMETSALVANNTNVLKTLNIGLSDSILKVPSPVDVIGKKNGMKYLTPIAFFIYISQEISPRKPVLCINVGKRYITVAISDRQMQCAINQRPISKEDDASTATKVLELVSEGIGGVVIGSLIDDYTSPPGRKIEKTWRNHPSERNEKLEPEVEKVVRGILETRTFAFMKYTYWSNSAAFKFCGLSSTEGFTPEEIKYLLETPEKTVAGVTLQDYLKHMNYLKWRGRLSEKTPAF